jgi:hypothetical protein
MRSVTSVCATALILGALTVLPAQAQQPAAPTDQQVNEAIALTRAGMASDRKEIVAANLGLTADEATKFWPVYDEYQKAMAKASDRKVAAIVKYAKNQQTMTDAMATELIQEGMTSDLERLQTRQAWAPKFAAVLPGKKFARFFQIENKIDALVNVAMADEIPLVK